MSGTIQQEDENVGVVNEDTPVLSVNHPPPKLEKEIRIPVLKIEQLLLDKLAGGGNKLLQPVNNGDSLMIEVREGASPPLLDKCIEDDNISIASSSTTTPDEYSCSIMESILKQSRLTIPDKPKKEKVKRRKAVKSKKTLKPKQQYLRIKIAPAAFGRRKAAAEAEIDEESDNGEGLDMDDVDDSCASDSRRKLRSHGVSNRGGDVDQSEDESEKRQDMRRLQLQKIEENNGDQDSRKSDDDDDGYQDDDPEHEWKPVRAAMVAALELVAKKQVTDDMRMERRIRKQVMKPLPPKGRGRRAIYKRLNKPMKSYEHTAGITTSDSVYYDHTFFHKGDIICLLQDLVGPIYPDLARQRFFQINGFIKVPTMDDCVSLTLLKRIIPVPEPKPLQEAADVIYGEPYPDSIRNEEVEKNETEMDDDDDEPYGFTLLDYRPANSAEIMVVLSQLKFVMHCPPDFYYGQDLLINRTFDNSRGIYARLGREIYEYDEEELGEIKRTNSFSDNDYETVVEQPLSQSINNSNSNSVKGDDNESIASSSNSIQTNNSNNHSSCYGAADAESSSCHVMTNIV